MFHPPTVEHTFFSRSHYQVGNTVALKHLTKFKRLENIQNISENNRIKLEINHRRIAGNSRNT
jgi:hypothetical protein